MELTQSREGFAPFGEYQTWYRVCGDLNNGVTPLVIAHGGPGCTHDYVDAFRDIAQTGRAVIHYDQIGNGRSTHLPDKPADFWQPSLFLAELDNLLRHLCIEKDYALLGQSWGGMLGAEHAVTQPAGLKALIIANSTIAIPFSVWMMTSYINGIPKSLDEAAMTDGCSRLQAMVRVILPLCAPGNIATGIYIFITAWNEYLYALTLGGQNVRPITVAVQTMIGEYQVQWGLLTAGGIVGAMPATILFLIVQRRLVGGLTQGAVKG